MRHTTSGQAPRPRAGTLTIPMPLQESTASARRASPPAAGATRWLSALQRARSRSRSACEGFRSRLAGFRRLGARLGQLLLRETEAPLPTTEEGQGSLELGQAEL